MTVAQDEYLRSIFVCSYLRSLEIIQPSPYLDDPTVVKPKN